MKKTDALYKPTRRMGGRTLLRSFVVVLPFLLAACTGTRFLKEGESFYTGAEITFNTQERVARKGDIRTDLQGLIAPKPNTVILGSRPGVWFYYIAGTPKKKKGLRSFVRNKLGQVPVLLKDATPGRTATLLAGQLNNEGYFGSEVRATVTTKRKKSSVRYTVELHPVYRLREISYPKGRDSTYAAIFRTLHEGSLLRPGQRYQLALLQAEQARIEAVVKNYGFYYFDDRYLIFDADSTVGERQVDLDLHLEPGGVPKQARKRFRVSDVSIYPNYSLVPDSTGIIADTVEVDSFRYIDNAHMFRPKVITRVVNIRPGQMYSRQDHDLTLNHLLGLGTFKFVNIKYTRRRRDSTALNASIYLTPLPRKSIRMEAQAVSKSNNFVGPGLSFTFTNRNFLGGAELFQFKLNSSYEVQLSNQVQGALNSFEIGMESTLTVPRFISPIRIDYSSRKYLPKTQFKLGFNLQNRVSFFRLSSFNVAYGYLWKESADRIHELYPIDINYVKTDKKSQLFQDLLDANTVLAKSFENQFIIGTRYSYTLNTQLREDVLDKYRPRKLREHNFYFNGTLDVAGNLINAVQSNVFKSEKETNELLGSPYSQYVKGEADFRYYWQLDGRNKIAARLIWGAGYAYGNSTTLPYIKQFSIGGSNSIRAFPARSIGPGTFHQDTALRFIDQRGDIKLEGNLEYRFDIVKSFKGALFLDAGNIWTMPGDDSRAGGEFDKDLFLDQLAVGSGLGFRFDFSFFVLRLDIAFPLRKPWLPEGQRWVVDKVDLLSPSWRSDNLIFNIAIGYPF